MRKQAELLPGTLDLLILKAVSLDRQHGYGVLLRIEQITGGALTVEQNALYPALHRLEHQGLLTSEWGISENNRRARYYKLTAAGRRRLGEAVDSWNRLVAAMSAAINTRTKEA
jgi:PadR family transcriptional regulator